MAEIENAIGIDFVRGRNRPELLHEHRGDVSVQRDGRPGRRVSIRDWHSFRTTWVTLALTAGIPLELVQKITGHRTVAVVMEHYFRPGREHMRRTLEERPPGLSTNGTKTSGRLRMALESLKEATRDNWQSKVEQAISEIEKECLVHTPETSI